MGLRVDDHNEPRSTPKLSLSKLPCKPKQPTEMLTPPLHPSLSIPFQWEEAPGKPRLSTNSLDLPPSPRLSHEDEELTIMSLPSPYVGRSMSLACTFSFRKGPREKKKGGRSRTRRWSFKYAEEEEEEMGGGGSFDFSQSLGDIFMREEKNAKMKGITRVRSFFDLSTINSNLLDIHARLKQAIPWRRRR